jgi:hypothetical protein
MLEKKTDAWTYFYCFFAKNLSNQRNLNFKNTNFGKKVIVYRLYFIPCFVDSRQDRNVLFLKKKTRVTKSFCKII